MSVTFVIGRAGAGKTHHCLESITQGCVDDPFGAPIIYLVPEQASYLSEKALLTHGKLAGYTRAQVLSFARLAEYVFGHQPAPRKPRLTSNHRALLVTLLVAKKRAEDPDAFASIAGMEDALSDFISESKQNAAGAPELRAAVAELRRRRDSPHGISSIFLEQKLSQLADLVEEFHAAAADRFEDPQDTLLNLSEAIVKSDALLGATIYVDGFVGYTPVEERVLVALARKAAGLTITIPGIPERMEELLSGEKLKRHPVFAATEETAERLARAFRENGVALAPMVAVRGAKGRSRFLSDDLRTIEESFLMHRQNECVCTNLTFHEAENPRVEARRAVELAARWIRDHGWGAGDIGILTRDLELYAPPLAEAFRTLRIPFFIDQAEPLQTHPFVVGIQSLIRAALRPGHAPYLLELAKSGLLQMPRVDADLLENHVLQSPRTVGEWYGRDPWETPPPRISFREDDERFERQPLSPAVDSARRIVAEEVRLLSETWSSDADRATTARTFVQALCDCLRRHVDVSALSENDRAILERLGALLNEEIEAAGDAPIHCELLGELTIRALGELGLPKIPPLLGEVFVGQVNRSRQPVLKGVIILGLSEGMFPKLPRNQSLLNDAEREILEETGLTLNANSKKQFARESLFAYMAFTTASLRIAAFRPRTSNAADSLAPSPYWADVYTLAGEPPVETLADDFRPEDCWRLREVAAAGVRAMDETHHGRLRDELRFRDFFARQPFRGDRSEADQVIAAAAWRNRPRLTADAMREYLGGRLRVSASQMESLGRCGFQHFVRYMLRPQEMMKAEFEFRDAGNFAHAALQNFTRALRERKIRFPISEEQLDTLFQDAIAIPKRGIEASGLLNAPTGQMLQEYLESMLREVCGWLGNAFETLHSQPVQEEADIRALKIAEEDLAAWAPGWDMQLKGQIDRIDTVTIGGARYSFVVDYKLRDKKFDYALWESGENLQLAFYLFAMEAHGRGDKTIPGGAFYLPLALRKSGGQYAKRAYSGVMRSSLARSLFPDAKWNDMAPIAGSSGDPEEKPRISGTAIADREFDTLMARSKGLLRDSVRQIATGAIDIAPSRHGAATACAQCEYQAICQVDYELNRARIRATRKRIDILQELRDANGEA